MTVLYDRAYELVVGTTKITGLRVSFKVRRTLKKEPNTAEITVYNLSKETRSTLQKENTLLVFQAGYKESIEQVFFGEVREVKTTMQGVDLATTITAGDGEKQFRSARINRSFKKGTPVGSVLESIGQSLGINVSKALTQLKQGSLRGAIKEFVHGYVASGKSTDELSCLLRASGLEGSIQDGELQVLELGRPSNLPAVVLSAQTGLVGVPEVGEKGRVKARSLLQAGLLPGRRVKVESVKAEINGFFRLFDITHVGDSRGGQWYTDIEGQPL